MRSRSFAEMNGEHYYINRSSQQRIEPHRRAGQNDRLGMFRCSISDGNIYVGIYNSRNGNLGKSVQLYLHSSTFMINVDLSTEQ